MLTTGVIKQVIISNNKAIYRVRLPLFETAGQKKEFIAPCNVCYAPGNINFYQEGDKVYVDFLCNSYSSPIIVGKIYQGQEETATNSSFNSTLEVTKTAKLPQNTSFGTLTVTDIENMRKQIEQYSDQFDIVNNNIDNINTDIEDVTETVETLSETVENLQEAVDAIDTATSTKQGLVKLGSDTVQSSAAVTPSSTSNRTYAVQLNNEGQMVVNVPWEGGGGGGGGDYTIATYEEDGLVRPAYSTTGMASFVTAPAGFSNNPNIEGRTTTSGRYYAIEMDSTGRMYVNVPWVNRVYYYEGTTYGECYSIDAPNNDYSIQIGDSGFTVDADRPGDDHAEPIFKVNNVGLNWWGSSSGSFTVDANNLKWNNTNIIPTASYSEGLQISSGSVSLYVPVDSSLDNTSNNPISNSAVSTALESYIPLTGTTALTGGIVPSTNASINLGSSSKQFEHTYSEYFVATGSGTAATKVVTTYGIGSITTGTILSNVNITLPSVNGTLSIVKNAITAPLTAGYLIMGDGGTAIQNSGVSILKNNISWSSDNTHVPTTKSIDDKKQDKITSTNKLSYTLLSDTPTIPAAQIQSDWNQTTTTAVDYIKNKPTIPAAQIQSDWNQTTTTAKDYIKNKPTIPAAQVNSDWNATSGVAEILNKPTSKSAASGGTDISLVTTGEKYTWNHKQDTVIYYYDGETYGECYTFDSPEGSYSIQIGESGFTVDVETPGSQGVDNIFQVYANDIFYQGISLKPLSSISSSSSSPVASSVIYSALSNKQDTLTSGTNIKTINNQSILGSGNLIVSGSAITTEDMTASAAHMANIFNTFIRGWVVPNTTNGATYNVFLEKTENITVIKSDSGPYISDGTYWMKSVTYEFTGISAALNDLTIIASASASNVNITIRSSTKTGTTVTVIVDCLSTNSTAPSSSNVTCTLSSPGNYRAYYLNSSSTKVEISTSKTITVMHF